jgi:hypothetical protein
MRDCARQGVGKQGAEGDTCYGRYHHSYLSPSMASSQLGDTSTPSALDEQQRPAALYMSQQGRIQCTLSISLLKNLSKAAICHKAPQTLEQVLLLPILNVSPPKPSHHLPHQSPRSYFLVPLTLHFRQYVSYSPC